MTLKYPWRRFWYKEARVIPIDEENGYLLDLESLIGLGDAQARSFSAIAQARCLILLGEPGLGKSTTLKKECETAEQVQAVPVLWFDLKNRKEEDLRRYLFECSAWRRWRKGVSELEVFLDSLDECYMRLETLPTLLAQELESGPLEKLRLRIVCRTAVWPQSFEEHLERLWPDRVQKYRLAPLRRKDVLVAAQSRVADADGFLNRVEQSGAGPLAAVPQTLELLFRLETGGKFPKTRVELFDKGCQKLCEEPDEAQWDKARAGHAATQAGVDHSQRRFHLASKIAGLTLFCGYRGLWLGRPSECPDDYLGPGVNLPLGELPSSVDELRDMSRAPLFRIEQADRVDWAHRSYAEYLAARFGSTLRPTQIARLLIHPVSPHIVPQLAGVAAWIASQSPEIFQMLLERDPQVLLNADLALTEPTDRQRLVNALLEGIRAGTFLSESQLRHSYRKLKHDKLVEQLQPWIAERSRKAAIRCEAIFMAAICQADGLQALLADIALAQDEDRHVRELAAWALTRVHADADTRLRLLPLARGAAGEDPEDNLKGAALEALWKAPRQIEVREMFELLTRPKKERYFGNYKQFIEFTLAKSFAPEHLPQALDWMQVHNPRSGPGEPFEELVDAILRCALEYLTDSILGSFARTVCQRLESYNRQIFGKKQKKEQPPVTIGTAKRRRLLAALIHLVPPPREGVYHELASHQPSLIEREDENWLLEQIESEKESEIRKQWAKLIQACSSFTELLHEAALRIPELLEEYAFLLKPVDINSPQAEQLRQSHQRLLELETRNRALIRSRDADRVVFEPQFVGQLLQQSETGEADAFWRLNLALAVAPDGQQHASEIISDLTSLPGWKALDPEVHSRICDTAQRFIQTYEPRACEDWFHGKFTGYRPEMAGYRAFLLLQQTDPSRLSLLSVETWRRWAHVIVGHPLASNTRGTAEPHQQLVAVAYGAAPEAVLDSVARLVNGTEVLHDGELYDLWKLEKCRDARMGRTMLDLALRELPRPPATLDHLIREALHCEGSHLSDVRDFVALVLTHASATPEARTRALISGAVFIAEAPSAAYPVIWSAITQDADFGKELMQKMAARQSLPALLPAAWVKALTEKQMADLWGWLCDHFPPEQDPEVDGFLAPRHHVSDLRNGLLQALILRGTEPALDELKKLSQEHPAHHLGLRRALLQAQEKYQQQSWKPLSPQQLLQMAKGPPMLGPAALVTSIDNETSDVVTEDVGGANMSVPLPELRRLIDRVVLGDAELDAFLRDYFPDVYRQVSAGMQRAAKVTLLFTYVPGVEEIVTALRDRFPRAAAADSARSISGISTGGSSRPDQAAPNPPNPNSSAATRIPLPSSLVTAIRQRRIIPFAGAGVSMTVLDRQRQTDGKPARLFPSWQELLERAVERLRAENIPEEAQLVLSAVRKRQPNYLLAAQTAQDGLGPLWYPFLRENFNLPFDRVIQDSLALARALWQLGSRLIITTNYDRVLRWACPQPDRENLREMSNQAAAEHLALLRDGAIDPTVWHLHGSIDDSTHIILTPDGYSRLYPDPQQGNVTYQAALQTLRTLISTHSLLFVGFSFTDPHFGDQLRWLQEVFAGAAGPHYLLVRQAELSTLQARLGNLRLELVPYAEHGQPLLDLLELLSREVPIAPMVR